MRTLRRNLNLILLAVSVVFVWRGVWGLADLFLFPENPALSFITSFAIGLIILYLHNPKKKDVSELMPSD